MVRTISSALALVSLLLASDVLAQSRSMSFEQCLATREKTIASLKANPRDVIHIVNTSIMTMTRICTADGSVVITCSKPDEQMVIRQSPSREGCQ